MALTFRKLHPHFAGESSPVELRKAHDEETLAPGASAISSSGTTAPRCTARGRSTTRNIAASSVAWRPSTSSSPRSPRPAP